MSPLLPIGHSLISSLLSELDETRSQVPPSPISRPAVLYHRESAGSSLRKRGACSARRAIAPHPRGHKRESGRTQFSTSVKPYS